MQSIYGAYTIIKINKPRLIKISCIRVVQSQHMLCIYLLYILYLRRSYYLLKCYLYVYIKLAILQHLLSVCQVYAIKILIILYKAGYSICLAYTQYILSIYSRIQLIYYIYLLITTVIYSYRVHIYTQHMPYIFSAYGHLGKLWLTICVLYG